MPFFDYLDGHDLCLFPWDSGIFGSPLGTLVEPPTMTAEDFPVVVNGALNPELEAVLPRFRLHGIRYAPTAHSFNNFTVAYPGFHDPKSMAANNLMWMDGGIC